MWYGYTPYSPPYRLLNFDPQWPRWADVNHWHPVEDWAAYVAACEPKLIGIRINDGLAEADQAQTMLKEAEQCALRVVGYSYGTAAPRAFLRLFPPATSRIPCLFYEGATANVRAAEQWVNVVAAVYGRLPLIYSSAYAWAKPSDPVLGSSVLRRCSWWGAGYSSLLRIPRIFAKAVAWQMTDGLNGPQGVSRVFAGIGTCDQSALLVPVEDL